MSPEALTAMKTLIQGAAGQGTEDQELETILSRAAAFHNNRTATKPFMNTPLGNTELDRIISQAVKNHETGALADEQLAAVDEGQKASPFTLPEDEMQKVLANAAMQHNKGQGYSTTGQE